MKTRWYKNAVVYQIYPFSFMDSNKDGYGDIEGIIEKLDYLKELGVTAIWFSPLYDSPNYDYGYDVRDYYKVSPLFGTNDDLKRLIDEIHKRGMRIIMDMVVNHTSTEHEWFKEAIKDKTSKYRNYYIIKEGIKKGSKLLPPNNWNSTFTGSGWERIEGTDDFYLHLFDRHQADLNWECDELRDEIAKIFDYYCKMGVDGFRLDVFNIFSKNQDFPNDKHDLLSKGRKYYIDGPRMHEFMHELYEKVFSKYDLLVVGESFQPDEENKKLYVREDRGEIDMIFDFKYTESNSSFGLAFLRHKFNFRVFKDAIINQQKHNHGAGWNTLVLNNHDQPRSVDRYGFDTKHYRYEAASMLASSVFMGMGTIFIYEGEEIGMMNTKFKSLDEFSDPVTGFVYNHFVRKFPISHKAKMRILNNGARDNARCPMQWDNSPNCGFTKGTPWMRMSDNPEINVENDLKSDKSIYRFYQRLFDLKKNYVCLQLGNTIDHSVVSKKIFAYTRNYYKQHALIISNYSNKPKKFILPKNLTKYEMTLMLNNYSEPSEIVNGVINLKPYETLAYKFFDDEKEYSYGAVLYRRSNKNNELEYCLLKMGLGHLSLPKGHIEEGETPLECVKREIKEELGVDVLIDDNFKHTITYSPYEGVLKDVTFNVGTVKVGEVIRVDGDEVRDIMWLNYKEAQKHLTYDADKEVLKAAHKYIIGEKR